MEVGKHLALIVDYGLTESKAGNGSVFIKFMNAGGETITWYGSLKEGKASEITIAALLECGFSADDINGLSGGMGSNLLITDEQIDIEVRKEFDQNGVERLRVKYIGSPKEIERMSAEKARTIIPASVNMALREMKKNKKPKAKKDPTFEIPFGS